MTHENINESLIECFFKIQRFMRQQLSVSSKLSHLSLLQLETMIFLNQQVDAQMLDIANYLQITKPTATSLLDKLVEGDLVTRNSDAKDRRLVKLSLTEKGKTLVEEGKKEKNKRMSKLLSYLNEEDKYIMLRILSNLIINIEQNNEKQTNQ
jgi:DNA-binding MarR family transcriptional regulator